MLSFFVNVLVKAGEFIVQTNNVACFWIIMDEPECPKSLIK